MKEKDLIEFIGELAQESGQIIKQYFSNPDLEVEFKKDGSPVTIADRKAEEIMRKIIENKFSDHGIIAEEYGSVRNDAEYVWVLDPIDGTKAFAKTCPLFGTLICLTKNGHPILGAIHQPLLNQLLIGNNETTNLNGRQVRVSGTNKLNDADLLCGNLKSPAKHQNGLNWENLTKNVNTLRTWGDCYGYLLVATGNADIALDPIMNSWDLLALIPIIRGAGGVISDWQGKDPVKGSSIVASNPHLHEQVIDILNA